MKPREAWKLLIEHCRRVGMPITHHATQDGIIDISPETAFAYFGIKELDNREQQYSIGIAGSTTTKKGWQKNFDGAWQIDLYFSPRSKMTWQKVAVLTHEMGHIIDFRTNMVVPRSNIQSEKVANKYGVKTLQLLNIPVEEITPIFAEVVEEHKNTIQYLKEQNRKPIDANNC